MFLTFLPLAGCIAEQADLKQESAQARARQSQEISVLREQELPQLRGELDRALHQAQELQSKQEDLKQRAVHLEQQTMRLEQLAGKLEADSTTRRTQIQESLNAQDMRNDVVIGTILLRMEKLEKRVQSLEKR